ncbi:SPOR domain-containing protein [Pontixanthobacter aquaemixtae]|uniref:SPOR domain-containing protein n=1 Tax=Pontixanthobacter aquaemixtae TaxID=1958940 RepID=A0A844ZRI1_9SPHN|nr:SPOR domain-containing protein [Pontixanthobacter aquaemixtae]MXO89417.1 SPOR domain-containing protein [Pontixanthobacter aquaemixtae]
MSTIAKRNRAITLAVTTALATTALAGCATQAAPRADFSADKAQVALANGQTNKAVTLAEESVLAEPRNAGYRAMLGATYMEAGRFQSAATSFKDAMSLGDSSARTALSYALAEIAAGNNAAAVAVLNDRRDSIDPADLGLALALAGDPQQGIHVLGNALRNGQATPKVRQNLAYSYALADNWRAARLMAAEDVPADKVSDRIAEWAQTARPEHFQARVAKLLNVPLVGDAGQPAMLALSNHSTAEQLAAEATADAPAQFAQAPAPVASPNYALPPMGGGELPPANAAAPVAPVQPVEAVAAYSPPPVAQPQRFEDAFVPATMAENPSPQRVAQTAVRFVSEPVIQRMPARAAAAPKAEVAGTPDATVAANGDHLVQLGSFSSEASAKRAWDIYTKRYPELGQYSRVITKARVRGKTYFRVSAGGFRSASAKSMCSTVKSRGQGCITWAANAPLPGAVDRGVRMASR